MAISLNKWDTLQNQSLKIASILDINTRDLIPDNKADLLVPLLISQIKIQDALSPATVPSASSPSPDAPPPKKQKLLTGTAWIKAQLNAPPTDPEDLPIISMLPSVKQRAIQEANKYLNMPSEDMDPLDWWRTHDHQFPHLKNIARQYLAIMSSGIPSERLWSTGRNVGPFPAALRR